MDSISGAIEAKIYPAFNGDLEQPSLYDPRLPAIFVKRVSHTLSGILDFEPKRYNRDLKDQLRLQYRVVHECGTIEMVIRLRGGGIGFQFSSMNDAHYQKFAKEAPSWREATKGLNLQGTCANEDCQAFNQRVVINKGMGHIKNIGKELFNSNCPACGLKAKKVNGLFFALCKYTFTGVQSEPEENRVALEGKAEREDACLRFSAEQVTWTELAITTSPLDESSQASNCVIV